MKTAAQPVPTTALKGRLVLSKSGWGLLEVPNGLVRATFAALDAPGVELPLKDGALNAHVSVFRPEEIAEIGGPDKIVERGRAFAYQLGGLHSVVPAGWKEMGLVYFIKIHSPELERLRRSYGLSSLPRGYAFHVTVAVRRKGVLYENAIKKSAEQFMNKFAESGSTPSTPATPALTPDGMRNRYRVMLGRTLLQAGLGAGAAGLLYGAARGWGDLNAATVGGATAPPPRTRLVPVVVGSRERDDHRHGKVAQAGEPAAPLITTPEPRITAAGTVGALKDITNQPVTLESGLMGELSEAERNALKKPEIPPIAGKDVRTFFDYMTGGEREQVDEARFKGLDDARLLRISQRGLKLVGGINPKGGPPKNDWFWGHNERSPMQMPWFTLGVPAAIAGGFLGGKAIAEAGTGKLREVQEERDESRARKKYESALFDEKTASRVDAAYDAWKDCGAPRAKTANDVAHAAVGGAALANMTLGRGFTTALALAGLGGVGYLGFRHGYNAVPDSREQAVARAIARRRERLYDAHPPAAVAVPIARRPKDEIEDAYVPKEGSMATNADAQLAFLSKKKQYDMQTMLGGVLAGIGGGSAPAGLPPAPRPFTPGIGGGVATAPATGAPGGRLGADGMPQIPKPPIAPGPGAANLTGATPGVPSLSPSPSPSSSSASPV